MNQAQPEHIAQKDMAESIKDILIASIQKSKILNAQVKEKTQDLKEELEIIPEYKRVSEAAKEAAKERNERKAQYLKRPILAKLNEEIKELRAEIRDNKETQITCATEYQKITQLSFFDMPDGTEAHIVPSATIITKIPKLSVRRERHATRA